MTLYDVTAWVEHAACAVTGAPHLWDATIAGETTAQQRARHKRALAVCSACPVAAACLAAVDPDIDEGVRGGTILHGPSTTRRPDIRHGTAAGYQAHRRVREDACPACKAALARAQQDRVARRREQGPLRPQVRCGTVSGHKAHKKRGEESCEPCKKAYNDYSREWSRRYRAGLRDARRDGAA